MTSALLLAARLALAHVGSPDVVLEGHAGPYQLLVSITPPQVIPGVAQVEIDSPAADLDSVQVLAMPLSGDGARFPPTPDTARAEPGAQRRFTAQLWLMTAGSWQVRLDVRGAQGEGALAIPVPALPQRTAGMSPLLGAVLVALLAFLVAGGVGIVRAGAQEAQLPPGQAVPVERVRRGRWVAAGASAVIALALYGGWQWWDSEARAYGRYIYKPLQLDARIEDGQLALTLKDPGWLNNRHLDDLLPDHGHLIHLYVVKLPELDRVWHLHPEPVAAGRFTHALPVDLPAGRYQLFADIVHQTGLAETPAAEVELTPTASGPLLPDDASGRGPPLSAADPARREAPLSEGKLVWEHDASPLQPGRVEWLKFRAEDAQGKPTADLEPYMGMLGHAAILKDDRSVFAHIHPTGSVPMAALAVAAGSGDPHAGHLMEVTGASEVSFPYRFPSAGAYRLIVQVKRKGTVETAIFDARVGS